MPLERFVGTDFSALLARARATLGEEAVVVEVRRSVQGGRRIIELLAADALHASVSGAGVAVRPGANAMRPLARARQATPLVVALVGPTGAGKTTTLAKIANHPQVFGGWPVGLLCLDTYRVGAQEQLRIYAELSGLPLEVAYDATEVPAALDRLGGCEVILVDTAGRGPKQAAELGTLLKPLRAFGPVETHLVLPAGLRPDVARRIVAQHRPVGITHLAATKLDECPDDDTVWQLAAAAGLGLRWVGDGQDVPHDLHSAATHLPGSTSLQVSA